MTALSRNSRVLVAADFDDASGSALKMAGALAAAGDVDLTVFHATTFEAPTYFTAAQIGAIEAEREQSRADIANRLGAFVRQHIRSAVRVVVGEGPPQDAILRIAGSFDLIVVGTHRLHGPRRWWLGSVAEAVVRQSPRPVLVVPAGAAVPETRDAPTILAAGGHDATVDAWVDALRTAFGGKVVRSPNIDQCAPDRVRNADLIVLSMPAEIGTPAQFGAIVQVLKECVRPVLFVPCPAGIVERSSS
ncbi:MAG: universal stress protein [Acidobacteriota bacterium]